MTLLPKTRTQIMEAAAREAARGGRPWPAIRLGWLVPATSVAVALVVAAVALTTHPAPAGRTAPGTGGGSRLVLRAESLTRSEPVTPGLLRREAAILAERLELELPTPAVVRRLGGDRLVVTSTSASVPELEAVIAATPRMRLYDWEANVLLPDGRSVASELAHSPSEVALRVSQGLESSAPGAAPAGGLDLYTAVRLAASQPASSAASDKPSSDQYYLFGSSGGAICATGSPAHCLLAGPLAVPLGTRRSLAISELESQLPGSERANAQVLVVRPGTIVLEAIAAHWPAGPAFGGAGARYFVLRDRVAVQSSQITEPRTSTAGDGSPDIAFSFSPAGARAFQRVTAAVAQRGSLLSTSQPELEQHIAVVVGDRIMSVPYIDYRVYPDGVSGSHGADLAGGFTASTAQRLVALLGLEQLPLPLFPGSGR